MRVLMLGWEFPPYLSGGLGTACLGLTRALSRAGAAVTFILPTSASSQTPPDPILYSGPCGVQDQSNPSPIHHYPSDHATESHFPYSGTSSDGAIQFEMDPAGRSDESLNSPRLSTAIRTVEAAGLSPYARPNFSTSIIPNRDRIIGVAPQNQGAIANRPRTVQGHGSENGYASRLINPAGRYESPLNSPAQTNRSYAGPAPIEAIPPSATGTTGAYDGDLFARAQQYADRCVQIAHEEPFDVIHAHDWLAFPAGLAVAAATGKPLVVHVHSTEFDRTGGLINRHIYEIERRGMHGAIRVIAVSRFTARILEEHYALEPSKIDVIHNGIELSPTASSDSPAIQKTDQVVLFLGRITFQKGPAYFLDAAEKVLQGNPRVKFLIAGDGDQMIPIIEAAAARGLGGRVAFAGFLRGDDVARAFAMADVFVMPSVSEPFGLAALEAASWGVPVIVSKKSGVAEVLKSVIQVDAWDTDDIAGKILNVLKKPRLAKKISEELKIQAKAATWDTSATLCVDSYQAAVAAMP